MKPTAKAEALQALRHVWSRLNSPDPLDGLTRHTLRATVEYAIEQIEQIQELKRPRRDKIEIPALEEAP